MASPPYSNGALSPPAPSPLALPRQRPGLALPSVSSRKSSFGAPSSAHPLRQTSFPPPDSLETRFSPDGGDDASLDDLSDADITSAISHAASDDAASVATATTTATGGGGGGGPGRKKRKRGEKRSRGRPPKNPAARGSSAGVANGGGDDARSTTGASRRGGTAGAASVVAGGGDGGDGEDEEDDEDEDAAGGAGGRAGAEEGFSLDPAEMEREKQRRTLFRETVPAAHQNRYDAFNKAKLKTQDIRRLVNATLSQSVPPGVTVVVGAYTKMFAGLLIEAAREVQAEWMTTEVRRPDNVENPAYKRLRLTQPTEPDPVANGSGHEEDEKKEGKEDDPKEKIKNVEKADEVIKKEPRGSNEPPDVKMADDDDDDNQPGDTQPNSEPTNASRAEKEMDDTLDDTILQPGAWGLSRHVDEHDRGPLLPDHLREALRRFKKAHNAGSVGFTGLSLEGREVAAPRMGGRRLFR